jgi:hypothetical protein
MRLEIRGDRTSAYRLGAGEADPFELSAESDRGNRQSPHHHSRDLGGCVDS